MKRSTTIALGVLLALACSVSVPVLLPPPFDVDGSEESGRPRLLLPTGIAVAPPAPDAAAGTSGHLLVVSSNLDRTYDSGTLLSFDPTWVAGLFDSKVVDVVAAADLPREANVHAAMIPE